MVLFMAFVGQVTAATEFWQQLTPEEKVAAGLEQLTPAQQAALDTFVARFAKEGARNAVEAAKEKGKEEGRAEVRAVVAEKKKASIGLAPREDDETEVVRTHIVGEFRGWEGRSKFTFENGQVWQQADSEKRFFPKMTDPEVEIRPSRFGGWKMTLVSSGLWIRVNRIR